MRRIIRNAYIISAVAVFTMLAGCASTDFDHATDFSQYRTFAWGKADSKVTNPEYKSDLINRKIRAAVESEFEKRGIVRSNNNPDFIVSFQTITEKKQKQTGSPYYYGFYPFYPFSFYRFGYGFGYPMWGPGPSQLYTYTEGTLIIDITDTVTDELVWRGTVSGNVDHIAGLQKQLDKAVKAIMKKYPVKPEDVLPARNGKDIS